MRQNPVFRPFKGILLGILGILLLLGLNGCFIQPDRTLDPLAQDGSEVLFATVAPTPVATPSPTPAASTPAPTTAQGGTWESWGGGGDATTAPGATNTPATGTSWQTSTEDYNAGYPVLRVGSTGNDVYDLQERLKELGYYTGSLDGKYASGTQDAVQNFQAANGLTVDGVAGRATQDKLYSASAKQKTVSVSQSQQTTTTSSSDLLKVGSSGTEVRKLQVRLAELGYYAGGADGIFGTTTESAVKAFQRNNSLSGDGQAGPATQKKLYSTDAKSASNPVATADPNAVRSLQLGMEGNDVYSLQKRLIELGYLNGVPDAVFGAETEEALRSFQRNNNLTVDGVAGASTQKKINGNAKAAAKTTATATPQPGSYVVMKEGDSGEYVFDIQERLYDLGYYTGRIDGRFESGTTQAIKNFQQAHNLTVDGVAGAATQRTLFSQEAKVNGTLGATTTSPSVTPAPTPDANTSYSVLREGSTGADVSRLQQYLFELGYYDGRVDGTFGTRLTAAVRKFQIFNGLTEDGIAGSATQAYLYSGQAVPLPALAATATPDLTTTLQFGHKGEAVSQLQHRLFLLGYLEENQINGTFGQTTVDAVKAFQEISQLKIDGAAGPETLGKLYSIHAEPASSNP